MAAVENDFRAPSESEVRLLEVMLQSSKAGADCLREQLQFCTVRSSDLFGSIDIQVSKGRCDCIRNGVFSDALFEDIGSDEFNGGRISVILFVRDGFIDELKIYKLNGEPIKRKISKDYLVEIV